MSTETQEQLENREITNRYRALLRAMQDRADNDDRKLIRKAFKLAQDAHADVRRKSGEPYIFHPLEVAQIVAKEIGLGPVSVAAALIHDVVEDSDYTLEDIDCLFGEEIARIIDGLTKISGVFDQDISMQAENFRKMLLTISDDIRVIIIKLADRLHNMRTMESMPAHKQVKIASETLYLYAPLAHRLGLYNIKTELEDLSLRYTEPEVYRDIVLKLKSSKADEIKYLKRFTTKIREELKKENFNFTIKERTKSIYSIRKKMINQGISFDEIYDKFAIRIILDSPPETEKADAWRVYSVVTDFYRPNPERLRDWISAPKSNGYESLHTTVMGPEGHWVEVQIRSERMDEVAEKGYAAHWKYKEDASGANKLDIWINQIREMLENNDGSALEFVNDFKLNLFGEEIYVFTPKGDLRILPAGASPLDFSFGIHTDVGLKTLGAKVNGRLVPLNYKLRSGDQIEILTSLKQKPKEDWLNYVVSAKAKSNIKSALKSEKKEQADEGKAILQRKLNYVKVKPSENLINEMVKYFGLKNPSELYYRVSIGIIGNAQIKEFMRDQSQGFYSYLKNRILGKAKKDTSKAVQKEKTEKKILVFGNEETELDYKLGKCCSPIPGDDVFGYITSNEGIKVHRHTCPNAIYLQSNHAGRLIKAKWISTEQSEYTTVLVIRGIDTVGLVNKVTQIISNDLNVNIRSINIAGDEGVFEGLITVVVKDKIHLSKVIEKLKLIEGVSSVDRR
ncbi:(p)ppGpp synthetase, RelA/SpoT family [Owenweeksia hongkongensis DSM 17368]|uniref:(P)ppGpp synthetase, RelA/SpoT family n=1 Tax=Owenweeksia hongkongensis (strain DSM 17368 / CIP 108786 / JCM 12287 / NRRL B-23963 / UST20020801) TaxID=926562 RepID=G8R8I6_OWEHD|nr:bifunctional (p)ppGpp synthetase/guanosine-3',5'-bis(diphosphate) 3'-pyrophosphohydrolase [Owenweeksia hongkongensis]AEV31368.1 (p)ppGpp synthetase, RelA/SpoT family [Owenweeksia hongkongensis DSM 17368]